ncbi:MAG: prepilin peptidase [Bacillota bacterium]
MPLLTAILLFVLGAILGSFANVCIWRFPRGESIAWPPSHCVHCQGQLKPWHLVPILSWVFLGGKCAMCGGRISFRYPVVELASALLFGAIGWQWGISLLTLRYCILTLALVIAVGTDLSHQEIPDQVSLGASAILGLIALVTLSWGNLLGGALLFCLLFLIAVASRGGMGGGDIKLALGIGLSLGWKLGLVALAVAFMVGGILAIALLIRGKRGKALPFGPFLALGAWIAMFFGDILIDLYITFSLSLWSW